MKTELQLQNAERKVEDLSQKLLEIEQHKEELKKQYNDKDKLLRNLLIEKVTKSDENVRHFLGLPSIVFLHGLFNFISAAAEMMKYWTRKSSAQEKRWQQNNSKKLGNCNCLKNLY